MLLITVPTRFKSVNSRVADKLTTGGTVWTTLTPIEAEYYVHYILPRHSILRYCPYHLYQTMYLSGKWKQAITVKTGTFRTGICIKRKYIKPLVREAKRNRKSAKKVVKKLGIRKCNKKNATRIMRYCYNHTDYVLGKKYAVDAFKGQADCAGITSMAYCIYREAGYDVRFMMGDVNDGTTHAFLRVKVGKRWYYADPTNSGNAGRLTAKPPRNIINIWERY